MTFVHIPKDRIELPKDITPMQALKAVRELLGCSLSEAKALIDNAPRWREHGKMHAELLDLVEKVLAEEECEAGQSAPEEERKIRHRVVSKKSENVDTSTEPVDGVHTSGLVTTDSPPCKKCGTIMVAADDAPAWRCPKCLDPYGIKSVDGQRGPEGG